jgi:hypothetical protein
MAMNRTNFSEGTKPSRALRERRRKAAKKKGKKCD